MAEAQQLAAQGVKELILISQITTNYGLDLYGKPQLAELLRALGEVEIPWIRVHYAYPTGLTPEVLAACLLYTSPSPRDLSTSRMPSSA